MGIVSAFMTGNYPRQPIEVYLSEKSANFSFVGIKIWESLKMSVLLCLTRFAALEIVMEHTFFCI